MKTIRKAAIFAGICFLLFFGIKHFEMSVKIAPLEEKFFAVATRYEGTQELALQGLAVYKGQLDRIVHERNNLLRESRYLKAGGWVVRGGRPETFVVCIYAGFLPQKWYDSIAAWNL